MEISKNAVIFISAPALILLALASAYALNPYAAIAAMLLCSILLFWLSMRKGTGGFARTLGYSCAFACLVLMAGIPSGEVGAKACPDTVENPDADARILFFYSPLCPHCTTQGAELDAFLSTRKDVRVERFDIRYCSENAEKYNFSGTPCIAVEKGGKLETVCGITDSGELSAIVGRLQ